jgi:hypothetical protein
VHSPLVGALRKTQGHATSQLQVSKYEPETFHEFGITGGGLEEKIPTLTGLTQVRDCKPDWEYLDSLRLRFLYGQPSATWGHKANEKRRRREIDPARVEPVALPANRESLVKRCSISIGRINVSPHLTAQLTGSADSLATWNPDSSFVAWSQSRLSLRRDRSTIQLSGNESLGSVG